MEGASAWTQKLGIFDLRHSNNVFGIETKIDVVEVAFVNDDARVGKRDGVRGGRNDTQGHATVRRGPSWYIRIGALWSCLVSRDFLGKHDWFCEICCSIDAGNLANCLK